MLSWAPGRMEAGHCLQLLQGRREISVLLSMAKLWLVGCIPTRLAMEGNLSSNAPFSPLHHQIFLFIIRWFSFMHTHALIFPFFFPKEKNKKSLDLTSLSSYCLISLLPITIKLPGILLLPPCHRYLPSLGTDSHQPSPMLLYQGVLAQVTHGLPGVKSSGSFAVLLYVSPVSSIWHQGMPSFVHLASRAPRSPGLLHDSLAVPSLLPFVDSSSWISKFYRNWWHHVQTSLLFYLYSPLTWSHPASWFF